MPKEYDYAESMAYAMNDPMIEREYYHPHEFASELGVCTGTVYLWIEKGWIEFTRDDKKKGSDTTSDKYARYRIHEQEMVKIKNYQHMNSEKLMRFVPRIKKES